MRIKHTSELKEPIKHWIDEFPEPPFSIPSYQFAREVKKIERHKLFSDLSNHLQLSGFDVWDRWKNYKAAVRDLDRDKKTLLKCIQSDINKIFNIKLRFVWKENKLEDYECCLPMFEKRKHL